MNDRIEMKVNDDRGEHDIIYEALKWIRQSIVRTQQRGVRCDLPVRVKFTVQLTDVAMAQFPVDPDWAQLDRLEAETSSDYRSY